MSNEQCFKWERKREHIPVYISKVMGPLFHRILLQEGNEITKGIFTEPVVHKKKKNYNAAKAKNSFCDVINNR